MAQLPCDGCPQSCGPCQGCGSTLYLTPGELSMLRRFGQAPFLPVARPAGEERPVFLEEGGGEDWSAVLRNLEAKGLITLDYSLPLSNFDYAPYASCPFRGSMALTQAGQDALEALEIQGVEG